MGGDALSYLLEGAVFERCFSSWRIIDLNFSKGIFDNTFLVIPWRRLPNDNPKRGGIAMFGMNMHVKGRIPSSPDKLM